MRRTGDPVPDEWSTEAVVDVVRQIAVKIRRHLGPHIEWQAREFAAICDGDRTALEIVVSWNAFAERQSLVDLALDDAHTTLASIISDQGVRRDRLVGDTNVRIAADSIAQGVTVFGPGGDEVGDRVLLTALGPCR